MLTTPTTTKSTMKSAYVKDVDNLSFFSTKKQRRNKTAFIKNPSVEFCYLIPVPALLFQGFS